MKKIHYLMLNLALVVSITSCDSNDLEQTPSDSVASANMWTSESLIDLGVIGVYQTLRIDVVGNDRWRFDENGSVGMARDNSTGFYNILTAGTATPGNGLFSTYWKSNYEGIMRANDAIKNIPLHSDVLPADKAARLIAEAKFLRAYFYFNLNMVYKGVPLYLEPITVTEATKPRETEDKIWQAIIADLTDCINTPSLPNMATGTSTGRTSKAAAYALRGKAYLYWKKYPEAAADLTTVGTLGPKLFDGTAGKYKLLFTTANETNAEMIFSVQNTDILGLGSSHQLQIGNRSALSSWNNDMYHPDYVDSFENADGSKFNWDTFLPNYSTMTPKARSVFFLRDNMTAGEKTKMATYGADMTKYLAVGNEARLKAAYANRDPRLAATVMTPYSTFVGSVNATYTLRWPYRGEVSPNFDTKTDTNNFFYYLGRKFVTEGTALLNRETGPIDTPLIRYADVVLMLAEALNEQGNVAAAMAEVNKVRARIGHMPLQNTNTNAPTHVSGQTNMRDRIRNERRWELPMEGHNLFDEMRWGTWKDSKFYTGNGVREIWGYVTTPYSWRGDYSYIWAIPLTEMQMNPSLTQNPGWIN
jgi:hypothetical protein